MTASLLATKLCIPPARSKLVPRPRLVERLDEGLRPGRCLILVSAPAGFGKTTLLSEWLGNRERPVAWLSLDEGDNDPVRFLAYLVATLQGIEGSIGESAASIPQTFRSPFVEEFLTVLLNQIGAVPEPFVLILDDYHAINVQPIHDAIGFLLDHLPPQMHLVVATRSDPPLAIARLRGRGQLTELRQADLRFTLDEAVTFLRQIMGLDLAADDVTALASRTEGWIAGLQMAAVSMQDREDKAGFIETLTGSNRYIMDYLVEEVLRDQPKGVQRFLLQTSILDRLTPSLCEAVTDQKDSQATLERAARANLFIVPLDDERRWYRYHGLFADLLRQRLHQTRPDQAAVLHRRAGAWCERNGLMKEAIDHTLAAGRFEHAAHLIEQTAEALLLRGRFFTLLHWLEALPKDVVHARPLLCIHYATALLFCGRPLEEVELHLQDAADDADSPVANEIALLRAVLASFSGDMRRSIELSQRALDLAPEEPSFLQNLVITNLATAYMMTGDTAIAGRAIEKAVRIGQQSENLVTTTAALQRSGVLHVIRGRLHQAKAIYERALEMTLDGKGRPSPVAIKVLFGLGDVMREWNDLEGATGYLLRGMELAGEWIDTYGLGAYMVLARLRQAQGDPEGAREASQTAELLAREFDAMELDDFLVLAYQARLWLAQGNLEAAASWAEERGLDEEVRSGQVEDETRRTCYHLCEIEYTTLARVYLAQGRPGEARGVLEPLLETAERLGRTGSVIEILALLALAFQGQEDTTQAMDTLARALALAEPEGYVRIFVDEGPPMARLLYEAAALGIRSEYAGRLLLAFPEADAVQDAPPRSSPEMVEPLSVREREVLSLIAEGLSNREVAQRLFLSLPTVKWHTSNIYGKLCVKNRTQAVAKARALGVPLNL